MKTNQISEAVKILLISASAIITCSIVWLGFHALNMGKEISNNAMSQMSELNNDIKDCGIMKFEDKKDIPGSEVVNFIKQYLGDYESSETGPFYVSVVNGGGEFIYTNGAYISNIRSFADVRYIEPTATFTGDVIKNSNDIIIGIKFMQH